MENRYDIIFNSDNDEKTNSVIKSYYVEGEDLPISYLPNSNVINIIVGSNNSGKSRFMRYLMSCKNLIGVKSIEFTRKSIEEYNANLEEFNEQNIFKPFQTYDNSGMRSYNTRGVDERKKRLDFLNSNRLIPLSTSNFSRLNEEIEENKTRVKKIISTGVSDDFFNDYSIINSKTVKNFGNPKQYFIPTLRSAHALFQQVDDTFSKIEHDIFLDTLQRYYDLNTQNLEIFTGLHLYKEILNSRNSKRTVRQSFEKFEKFIGESFFGSKQIDIVAEFNKDESLLGKNYSEIISVHIEGEKETRNLYELGDGIQAIVILMYKIFMAEENSFIFIDEPELNLHPGMQRLFLDQISSNKFLKSKNLTYFISTHSNHFLDLTIEKKQVSIYSFSPSSTETDDKTFTIRNVNYGDITVLKNLGVSNSSVFLANCSIWVEGISDRNYIKAFLKSYISSLNRKEQTIREDIDFAFFEYAGSNIEHYFFDDITYNHSEQILSNINSLALNNKIFLIADSDNAKKNSKKGMRLLKLTESKRDNFHPYISWNFREVENLLTKEVWEKILITLCNKNLVKKHSKVIQSKISAALEEIKFSTYNKKYIGEFLNDISQKLDKLDSKTIINESSYMKFQGSYGTLINKRELSEKVLEENFPWEVFEKNNDIKELTESIYKFIISN